MQKAPGDCWWRDAGTSGGSRVWSRGWYPLVGDLSFERIAQENDAALILSIKTSVFFMRA